jgi:hypothetical protein
MEPRQHNENKSLPILWLVFTILFGYFSVNHFLKLFHSIPHFELQSKKEAEYDFYNSVAIETKANMANFATRWNEYVD